MDKDREEKMQSFRRSANISSGFAFALSGIALIGIVMNLVELDVESLALWIIGGIWLLMYGFELKY